LLLKPFTINSRTSISRELKSESGISKVTLRRHCTVLHVKANPNFSLVTHGAGFVRMQAVWVRTRPPGRGLRMG
jgi:hypothetical protein